MFIEQARKALQVSPKPEAFRIESDEVKDLAEEFEYRLQPDGRSKKQRLKDIEIQIRSGNCKLFGIPVRVQ